MIASRIFRARLFPAIVLAFIVVVVPGGCAVSNYGKLKSNQEIAHAFQTYQILPGHQYYYRGTFSRPIVVAGIKEKFELNSKLWVKIDIQSQDFRTLIDRVTLQGTGTTVQPWGFTILDKSGNDVGVWYSAIRAAAVEVNENNQIVNLSPLRVVTRGDQR